MEPQDFTRSRVDPQSASDEEVARLARRLEAERELARLAKGPVDDPSIATTVILIVAAVSMAAIIAALYFGLR